MSVTKTWGVLAAIGLLATAACSAGRSDGGTKIGEPEYPGAPSCQDLSAQYAACPNATEKNKQSFITACQDPRITDACRRCLDGKLCGDTDTCDGSCGK